jgi:hypothetical protein
LEHGRKTIMSAEQSRRAAPFAAGSKRWTPRVDRSEPKGSQNAQRNYERYLALAGAASLTGDSVGAENYYQHAEHFFRSMSSDQLAVLSMSVTDERGEKMFPAPLGKSTKVAADHTLGMVAAVSVSSLEESTFRTRIGQS